MVALRVPATLLAIGEFYVDFTQTWDEEVIWTSSPPCAARGCGGEWSERGLELDADVEVVAAERRLPGILAAPIPSVDVVLFTQCSGSSRLKPRNLSITQML